VESPGHHQAHVHGVVMSLYTRSSIVTCGHHRRFPEIPGVAAPREPVGCPLVKLHRVPRIPRSTSSICTDGAMLRGVHAMSMYPLQIELTLFSCDYGYAVKCICGLSSPFHQFGLLVQVASALSLTLTSMKYVHNVREIPCNLLKMLRIL
jgi:hypothetical protein